MFSCRAAAILISESLDHPLSWTQRFSLRFHLVICRVCRRYRRQVVGLNILAQRYLTQSAPVPFADDALSPKEKDRLILRLRQAQAAEKKPESP